MRLSDEEWIAIASEPSPERFRAEFRRVFDLEV